LCTLCIKDYFLIYLNITEIFIKYKYSEMNRLLENLSSPVSQKELQNAERKFMSNYEKDSSWRNAAFEYACCLLRSGAADVRNGIRLFEDLLEANDNDDVDEVTNDQCIFCMAFGYYRIEEYATSLRIIKGLLEVKPHCKATLDLQRRVNYEITLRRIKSALWVAGGISIGMLSVIRYLRP
ncbi:Mitochondrial fission 1 protein, partial [Trichinella zimbabwensis]